MIGETSLFRPLTETPAFGGEASEKTYKVYWIVESQGFIIDS